MLNLLKLFRKKKVGLALGSGGAKGMAHIAVIEFLGSMGIPINYIAGSSIGSLVGALYCCGSLGRFKEDMRKMTRKDMLSLFDPVFPRSGLLQGADFMEFMKKYIPPETKIEDLPVSLAVTSTDYTDGKTVIFRTGNLLEAVRASISIPGILVPVKYRGTYLIDGGVSNPLPVNVLKKMGAGFTIAVNLHPAVSKIRLKKYARSVDIRTVVDARDLEVVREEAPREIPGKEEDGGSFFKTIEKYLGSEKDREKEKRPSIFDILMKSFDIMEFMNTRMMLKYNPPTVLLEPDALEYGTMDFMDFDSIMDAGLRACIKARGNLKRRIGLWV